MICFWEFIAHRCAAVAELERAEANSVGWRPLRRIVIDRRPFRWRFTDVLVVIPSDRSGPQLYVDWGWRDWLESDGPGAEPHVVTPRFVTEAVRFAAAMGWPFATGGQTLRLGFRGGRFTAAAPDTESEGEKGSGWKRGQVDFPKRKST